MTPTEVDQLDNATYRTFVTFMNRQAFEAERATKRR